MKDKFLEAMTFRHACKKFDINKKISDEEFNSILDYGRLSPSSFGLEPWRFVIVQNMKLRKEISKISWGGLGKLETCSHFVLIFARKREEMLADSEYVKHIRKDIKEMPDDVFTIVSSTYDNFLKNDFKIRDSKEEMFSWACRQTYIALANMMTGAASLNIDSCPIEGFDKEKMDEFASRELKIDSSKFGLSVMVAFGYRLEGPRHPSRQKLGDIVEWH